VTVELLDRESGSTIGEPVTIATSRGVVPAGAVAAFDLPGRPVSLRFAVAAADGATLDRWTQAVEPPVNDGDGALSLSSLAFHRARSVAEFRALRETPTAAPSATRRFVRTDRVQVRAVLPAADTGDVAVTAELLNKAGQRLAELACARAGDTVALELPLTSLVPSTYLVRVRATAGARVAEQVAAFEMAR
jgi:hypothetical protein